MRLSVCQSRFVDVARVIDVLNVIKFFKRINQIDQLFGVLAGHFNIVLRLPDQFG